MKHHYLGIDLGTSNSSCALFDGTELQVVRSERGSSLIPSVVRISPKGQIFTGSRAQRYLERDPANTRAEFKRLMGTEQQMLFPASGQSKTPTELSAAIISSLLDNVEQQFNIRPTRATVTVPALFDLPQSNATAEAAAMAGLEKIELLQEPVASALAAGWNEESLQQSWLVYDLGGGTFDASLLEFQDGMLRVVAHDGDNFLGGRDFDKLLADWIIAAIEQEEKQEQEQEEEHGQKISIQRDSPDKDHKKAIQLITLAAEETKIDLSTREESEISLFADVEIDGQPLDIEITIDRTTFESLCQPLVDRSIEICNRLLRENMQEGKLDQVVLVGGPSMMPIIREQVASRLAPIASGSLDPMTLVAQGAALHGASTGLSTEHDIEERSEENKNSNKFILQHPTMSSDLQPVVIGRLVEKSEPLVTAVQLINQANQWSSDRIPLEDDVFMLDVQLQVKTGNLFTLNGFDKDGSPVPVRPETLSIVHGISISDPPLSRSIGVALSNGGVRRFFDRGTPLPIKRTFTHHSVDTVLPGKNGGAITIPVVQGEFNEARYCRSIGSLIIRGDSLKKALPTGTGIEITLELDRGGSLKAQALVPSIDKLFNGVLHLIVAGADLDTLRAEAGSLRQRLSDLQKQAFKSNNRKKVSRYIGWLSEMEEAERDIASLQGGDQDAGQRAGYSLTSLAAKIDQEETVRQLEQRCQEDELGILYDCDWIRDYGTEREKSMLTRALQTLEQAAKAKDPDQYSRQREVISKLGTTAYERSPDGWAGYFEYAAARIHEAGNLKKGERLVWDGRKAMEKNDQVRLKKIVHQLWNLLPADAKTRQESFDSGIR